MNFKQKILRSVFFVEMALFIGVYCFGSYGLQAVFQLKAQNKQIDQQVQIARDSIQKMQQELELWETDPFYTEQYAREKLAMAHDGDEIFLIK